MKNIILVIPKLKDYSYEQYLLSDPKTMDYNAGYDIESTHYHFNTGCIDFEERDWKEQYNKRKLNSMYFAYIKDLDLDQYVGYVNYQLVGDRYECGIVIEGRYRHLGYAKPALHLLCQHAFNHGVNALYDHFETSRIGALNLFIDVGFKIYETTSWLKFRKETEGVIMKLSKEDYKQ